MSRIIIIRQKEDERYRRSIRPSSSSTSSRQRTMSFGWLLLALLFLFFCLSTVEVVLAWTPLASSSSHSSSSTSSLLLSPFTTVVNSRKQSSKGQRPPPPRLLLLRRMAPSDVEETNKKKKGNKGVYVRPSGAIERGSGFYVPGLEGAKVRLVVGGILLSLTGINHFLSSGAGAGAQDDGTGLPETIAVVYTAYVLFQACIEFVKEQGIFATGSDGDSDSGAGSKEPGTTTTAATTASNKQLVQQWSSTFSSSTLATLMEKEGEGNNEADLESFQSRVEWSAATFLALTPSAGQLLLLSKENIPTSNTSSKMDEGGNILYRLGLPLQQQLEEQQQQQQQEGITAAFNALEQSTSGRIALPLSHPAVVGLASVLEVQQGGGESSSTTTTTAIDDNSSSTTTIRTVVLQRITPQLCWMMTSNDLLARFTNQDWKWLTQLGRRVVMESSSSSSS